MTGGPKQTNLLLSRWLPLAVLPAVLHLAVSPLELVVVDELDDSSLEEEEEATAGPADQQMSEYSAQKFTIPWTVVHKLNAHTMCGAGKNKTHTCLECLHAIENAPRKPNDCKAALVYAISTIVYKSKVSTQLTVSRFANHTKPIKLLLVP